MIKYILLSCLVSLNQSFLFPGEQANLIISATIVTESRLTAEIEEIDGLYRLAINAETTGISNYSPVQETYIVSPSQENMIAMIKFDGTNIETVFPDSVIAARFDGKTETVASLKKKIKNWKG